MNEVLYPEYYFQRMFSFFVDVILSKYICVDALFFQDILCFFTMFKSFNLLKGKYLVSVNIFKNKRILNILRGP
ncbi:hypothetical protein NSA23_02210 [Anaerosalibacter massiliensis]|mgnify:CR=1 FL=1|uniref:Uncharacterized protein n=1 Tax=Anaerosalibacter massiliensis TaxID=1347392 RepID=A0A9X2MG55_9FIRM|nr:hypothetical protein [Anaerosalibacter massiliensis]MCR2042923.1 hypothetical protein [Anaerosalibacter massiliensis]